MERRAKYLKTFDPFSICKLRTRKRDKLVVSCVNNSRHKGRCKSLKNHYRACSARISRRRVQYCSVIIIITRFEKLRLLVVWVVHTYWS